MLTKPIDLIWSAVKEFSVSPAYSLPHTHTSVPNLHFEVAQMNKSMKQILRRAGMLLALTAFCITGSYVFSHRRAEPSIPTAGTEAPPVIVLDAGHGEST
jgi:hypothetical protein